MAKDTVLFKAEAKMNVQEVASTLHELADRIALQKVVLKKGGKQVKLKFPEMVGIEIKVEKIGGKKRSKRKLEIEIDWFLRHQQEGNFSLG